MSYEIIYTYIKYEFSEEATKYSKKVAVKKYFTLLVLCSMVLAVIFAFMFISFGAYFLNNIEASGGELADWIRNLVYIIGGLLGLVLAVLCGWMAEKAYVGYCERKIEEAITRDIVKLEGQYSHREVEAYRKKLLEARKEKQKKGQKGDVISEIGRGKVRTTETKRHMLLVGVLCMIGLVIEGRDNPVMLLVTVVVLVVFGGILLILSHHKKD